MKSLKLQLLAATAVAAGSIGMAHAATVQGNGASLPAGVLRVAGDCYGQKIQLTSRNGALESLNNHNFVSTNTALAYNCDESAGGRVINPADVIFYVSTGSGRGIEAFYMQNPTRANTFPAPNAPAVPGTYTRTHYALSETALNTAQAAVYNNGGYVPGYSASSTGTVFAIKDQAGNAVSTACTGTCTVTQVDNPRIQYGRMIQLPLLIAPIAITYDPVYGKVRAADGSITELKLRIKVLKPTATAPTGGLKLNQVAYCGIFNGQITNWNHPLLTTLNGNQSLRDLADPVTTNWSVPMYLVGRSDNSGTTSLWTRHLAKVCGDLVTAGATIVSGGVGGSTVALANQYANSTNNLPGNGQSGIPSESSTTAVAGSLAFSLYTKNTDTTGGTAPLQSGANAATPGTYARLNGNDGVQQYVNFPGNVVPSATVGDRITWGRIGYGSPDYVLPAAANTGLNGYGLWTASVLQPGATGLVVTGSPSVQTGTVYVDPTPLNASSAFGTILAPESTSTGAYSAGSTGARVRTDPGSWVEPADKASPLALPAKGYPIVGTSNVLMYQCYKDAAVRYSLVKFLSTFYSKLAKDSTYASFNSRLMTDTKQGVLGKSGFAALPTGWATAINNTFFSNNTATVNALNLWVINRIATTAAAESTSNLPNTTVCGSGATEIGVPQ